MDDNGVRRLKGQTAIIISEYEMADGPKSNMQFTVLEGSSAICNETALDLLSVFAEIAKHGGRKVSGDLRDGEPNDKDTTTTGAGDAGVER